MPPTPTRTAAPARSLVAASALAGLRAATAARAGMRAAAAALGAAATLLGPAPALAARPVTAVVKTDQVRAELVAHAPQGVAPGQPLQLGLRIDHAPQWHTYWKNPGDSGLATTLQWTLPPGFSPGEIAWPTPQPLPVGPLMNFGYEGALLLPVAVSVPAGFAGQELVVKLRADWLVCRDVCIPEGGDFLLRVPARAATALHGSLFERSRERSPRLVAQAQGQARVEGNALEVRVQGVPADLAGRALRLLPELPGVIDNAAAVQARWDGSSWLARVALSPQRSEAPTSLQVVLVADGSHGSAGAAGAKPAAEPPAGLQLALRGVVRAVRVVGPQRRHDARRHRAGQPDRERRRGA